MTQPKFIYKNVQDITNEDTLVGYVDGKYVPTKIQATTTSVRDHTLKVFLDDGSLLHMTVDHPVLTTDGYKVYDRDVYEITHVVDLEAVPDELAEGILSVGDSIVGIKGNRTITALEVCEGERVYTIHRSETSNYVVEGLVVHNKPCVIAGTRILVSDLTEVPVEELKPGTEIMGWVNDSLEPTTFREVVVHENRETMRVYLEDETYLQFSLDHPVLTEEGYKVFDLVLFQSHTEDDRVIGAYRVGDSIMTRDGFKTIVKIAQCDVLTTYDIAGSATGNYIAEGVVSFSSR